KRALAKGLNMFNVLCASSYNTKQHYKLNYGLLQLNDSADFIVVDNLEKLNVIETYIAGNKVAEKGTSFLKHSRVEPINNFNTSLKQPEDFKTSHQADHIRVIKAIDGQLITEELQFHFISESMELQNVTSTGSVQALVANDILKIAVVNRY